MFFNTGNLNYIKLYDINVSEGFLQDLTGEFGINNKENLMVCQSQKFITNEKEKFFHVVILMLKKEYIHLQIIFQYIIKKTLLIPMDFNIIVNIKKLKKEKMALYNIFKYYLYWQK